MCNILAKLPGNDKYSLINTVDSLIKMAECAINPHADGKEISAFMAADRELRSYLSSVFGSKSVARAWMSAICLVADRVEAQTVQRAVKRGLALEHELRNKKTDGTGSDQGR